MGLSPVDESRAYTSFLVSREREGELMSFLKRLEADKEELHITDLQLSLTSLEEVRCCRASLHGRVGNWVVRGGSQRPYVAH